VSVSLPGGWSDQAMVLRCRRGRVRRRAPDAGPAGAPAPCGDQHEDVAPTTMASSLARRRGGQTLVPVPRLRANTAARTLRAARMLVRVSRSFLGEPLTPSGRSARPTPPSWTT
jgi:hypothetical protein